MGIKITTADEWFSRCVRERSNWTCEYAGTVFPDGQASGRAAGLHCSHFYSRGNWATRFEPLNAFAHSYGSHAFLGSRPVVFDEWVKSQLGDAYDLLVELSNDRIRAREYKRANTERGRKNPLAMHYKAEFERMREMRMDGEAGRINFVGFV